MPLLFEIYDHGRRLTDYKVRGGFVVGPESVPMPGAVRFEDGLLRVDTGSDPNAGAGHTVDPGDEPNAYSGLPGAALDAVGVCLLWGCAAGEYLLETTRLPPREAPYVLNVELARHRLMKLLHKQEDWNLWDLPPAGPAVAKAKQAQALFAEALGLLHDPAAAATKADEALILGIEAGEELAIVHGDLLLARRRRTGMPRTMFAIRADTSEGAPRNAAYRAAMIRTFDCVNVPMPWRQMQPDEDVFSTGAVDSTVEFLARNRVPMIAGPLLDLSEGQVPEWLFIYEHDFETLRDLAFEYVKSVVTRYRRVIKLWNVTAGLHASGSFGLTFEQMVELTRLLVAQVKAVLPAAKTLVSVRQPYGEYLSLPGAGEPGASTAVPPMLYAEMVSQSGVQVDGFGVEIVTGVPKRGRYCRDLFQISAMLDRFATLNKPLFVTAIACPDGENIGGPQGDPGEAGRWRRPWSRDQQALWLREVTKLALSKPFVETVSWGELSDGEQGIVPGGGLLDDLLKPKPAYDAWTDLRNRIGRAKATA